MKYVACYCRVSHDEQVKFGFSIQAQKDALEKYCKENNYKYEFYIDEGISASSMRKRKALNDMLNKANVFDMVLFTKLDRLSRNVLDANNINKLLLDNHCTMKAIDEDDIDTSTADGTFIFNLKVSLAQREIGKTSERINFVFNSKRNKGEVTSGTKKYGYDIIDKHYVVNEKEAENIIELYKYFISVNGNIQKTYEYFIKHFQGKGYDALKNYLRETAYIGKYKLYRKDIYIDNYIPRIMDDCLFYEVQNLIQKKQKYSKSNIHTCLFSGLLYCNNCKHRMIKKYENRVKNPYSRYGCDYVYKYVLGTNKKVCSNSMLIREEYIEKYLLDNLKEEAKKYIVKNTFKPKKKKVTNNDSQIKSLELKLNKLKDLYIDDLIDKETYKNDYLSYNKQIEELKKTNLTEPNVDLSNVKKILDLNIVDIYNNLTQENKRQFWLSFIDKIYVENKEIKEIIFL